MVALYFYSIHSILYFPFFKSMCFCYVTFNHVFYKWYPIQNMLTKYRIYMWVTIHGHMLSHIHILLMLLILHNLSLTLSNIMSWNMLQSKGLFSITLLSSAIILADDLHERHEASVVGVRQCRLKVSAFIILHHINPYDIYCVLQTVREHEGPKLIQRLVNFVLYYIGWLKLPVRR